MIVRKFGLLLVILIMFLPGCGWQGDTKSNGQGNGHLFSTIFTSDNSDEESSDRNPSGPIAPGDGGGDEDGGGDQPLDPDGGGDEDGGGDQPLDPDGGGDEDSGGDQPLDPNDGGGDEDSGDNHPFAPLFPDDGGRNKEQDIKTEAAPRFWDDRIRYKFPLKLGADWDIGSYGQGVGMDGFVIMASSEDPKGAAEFLRDQITAYKDNGIVMKILSEESGDDYYYFEAKMVGFGLYISVSPDGITGDICSIVLRENGYALDNNEYREALEGRK